MTVYISLSLLRGAEISTLIRRAGEKQMRGLKKNKIDARK